MIGNVYKESVLNFPMVEKKEEKTNKYQVKHDFSMLSYGLGLASLATALFLSPAAIILGIMGVIHAKKQQTLLSKKATKLSAAGLIAGIIIFAAHMIFLIINPSSLLPPAR